MNVIEEPEKTAQFEAAVLAYWTAKLDTWEIAQRLGVPESQVANALPRVLERRRAERLAAAGKTLRKIEQKAGVAPVKAKGLLIA